ncbi:MAG: hypothetical protein KGZ79_07080 [Dethiobacter sp.]|nr:hypothetical protein [Dethiobacter sp.]
MPHRLGEVEARLPRVLPGRYGIDEWAGKGLPPKPAFHPRVPGWDVSE